ncbi:MAG: N-acetylmuramoyl-L-alanine amidase [Muribaculaceae bacterium]|nr:N-acetylmuramoyl-L-alanine amidase [Muribaculaceae bacterium]
MKKYVIILDAGHGADTPGKRSPDGLHREWRWCRDVVGRIAGQLRAKGFDVRILVPEDADVPLAERCRRANAIAAREPALLISVHNNAAGDGSRWLSASGFSAFVAPNASARSQRLAALLTAEASAHGLLGNRCTPREGYWTASLAICRDTVCPAVLTENMFQDSRSDVALLASEEGREALARVHVDAVLKFCNTL